MSHHRYKVSADQIACKTARTYSVRMLKSRTYHPPHWTCARYKKSETSLVFRCENRHHTPIQTVFAAR